MCGRRDWINIPRNIVLAAKQLETRWSSGRKSDANNIEILYLGNTRGRFVLSAIARCFFWPPYMKGRAFSWERAVDLLRPGWGLELITYLCLQMDGWGGYPSPMGGAQLALPTTWGGDRAVPERGGVWEVGPCFLDLSETREGKSWLVRNLVTKYLTTALVTIVIYITARVGNTVAFEIQNAAILCWHLSIG